MMLKPADLTTKTSPSRPAVSYEMAQLSNGWKNSSTPGVAVSYAPRPAEEDPFAFTPGLPWGFSPMIPSVRDENLETVGKTEPKKPKPRPITLVYVTALCGSPGESRKVCWQLTAAPSAKLSVGMEVALADATDGPLGIALPIVGVAGMDRQWINLLLQPTPNNITAVHTVAIPATHVVLPWLIAMLRHATLPWMVNEFLGIPLPLPSHLLRSDAADARVTHLEEGGGSDLHPAGPAAT